MRRDTPPFIISHRFYHSCYHFPISGFETLRRDTEKMKHVLGTSSFLLGLTQYVSFGSSLTLGSTDVEDVKLVNLMKFSSSKGGTLDVLFPGRSS